MVLQHMFIGKAQQFIRMEVEAQHCQLSGQNQNEQPLQQQLAP
jgi:hypothetical protein